MLINGRYQVLQPLQEGGFGHTFLAEDTQLPSRRRCVIKQLKPIHDNPGLYQLIQERFQREAAIQETLGEASPYIPRLYAYFNEGDHFFLVEEWIEGETLRQKLLEVGRFSEVKVRELLLQLLPTIETVHQHQIIHRDIKPDNVILRKRDGNPVLIDFGAVKESMATIVNTKGQTARSIVVGTTGYMAPEQSAGHPLFASDLYSLGLTAIYLLTGRSPAELNSDPLTGKIEWRSQAPQVSDTLASILDKAIQMYPAERYSHARAMYEVLQQEPEPDLANHPTVVSHPPAGALPVAPFNAAPAAAQASPPAQIKISSSSPPTSPTGVTEVVSPVVNSAAGTSVSQSQKGSGGSGDWIKAMLIGGGIGSVLLLGVILLRGQPSVVVVQPSPLSPSPAASQSEPVSPSPIASSPEPSPSPEPSVTPSPTEPVSTAPETCGDPVDSGQTWYPIFLDNADVAQVRQDFCQDAIAKKRDNGTPTVQVASFSDPQRAADFAQKVGGEVGVPYQVGASPSPSANPSSSPNASPTGGPRDGTNAVIVGNKGATNIRRGPGTNHGVQHIAYPGDRVKILDTDYDSGGYRWYKVYFPKSSASGWIAGQLLQPD
jgi:serine/threonine-protein kinase